MGYSYVDDNVTEGGGDNVRTRLGGLAVYICQLGGCWIGITMVST